jgi:hypothetical protein
MANGATHLNQYFDETHANDLTEFALRRLR